MFEASEDNQSHVISAYYKVSEAILCLHGSNHSQVKNEFRELQVALKLDS